MADHRVFRLYGLAVLLILGRTPCSRGCQVAYVLCALANAFLAVMAGADAAHFAELKAEGHGEGLAYQSPQSRRSPAGRRAGQAGQSHSLDLDLEHGRGDLFGDWADVYSRRRHRSPLFIRNAIDFVSGPTTFFVGATIALAAMIRWRKFVSNGLVGWCDRQPVPALLRPEHVGLRLPGDRHQAGQCADRWFAHSGRFFHWLGLRRAVINDARIDQGLPDPGRTRTGQDPDLARPGLHRADLHGPPDDLPGRLGNRAPGPARTARELDRRSQPLQGPLVLPRSPGNAGVLRSLDGRRRAAEP